MTDPTGEAVERAAIAVHALANIGPWSDATKGLRETYRKDARAALQAAYPKLAERLADLEAENGALRAVRDAAQTFAERISPVIHERIFSTRIAYIDLVTEMAKCNADAALGQESANAPR